MGMSKSQKYDNILFDKRGVPVIADSFLALTCDKDRWTSDRLHSGVKPEANRR